MPPKRTSATTASPRPSTPSASSSTTTPAAASPSTVAASQKPSSAVSSKPPASTSASLRSSASPSTSASTSSANAPTPLAAAKAETRALRAQAQSFDQIVAAVWNRYVRETPQRAKLVDAFMAFLVVVGGLQFLYVVLVGNYPFNAFLSGFGATVGQFVLTASLRMQTNPANRAEFASVGDERAFADYVFGSLLLHFFCVNFIN